MDKKSEEYEVYELKDGELQKVVGGVITDSPLVSMFDRAVKYLEIDNETDNITVSYVKAGKTYETSFSASDTALTDSGLFNPGK